MGSGETSQSYNRRAAPQGLDQKSKIKSVDCSQRSEIDLC